MLICLCNGKLSRIILSESVVLLKGLCGGHKRNINGLSDKDEVY